MRYSDDGMGGKYHCWVLHVRNNSRFEDASSAGYLAPVRVCIE